GTALRRAIMNLRRVNSQYVVDNRGPFTLGCKPATQPTTLVYCVLATGCDCSEGWATVTNSVARSNPTPSGVGIEKRNGTSRRVPAIGASQTSASRSATRYLIAGRSGTYPAIGLK